jgi:hypothetical protein
MQMVRVWYLRTGGIYQDSLLNDVATIGIRTFDKYRLFCTKAHPKFPY